ncbi:hypothetical protein M426DRAFT_15286 [Hypoxylon sp. CI-4A]|nr:hypothetical protein M426DRAFT_15286 [Hypoxylon sp. CI-4A]
MLFPALPAALGSPTRDAPAVADEARRMTSFAARIQKIERWRAALAGSILLGLPAAPPQVCIVP